MCLCRVSICVHMVSHDSARACLSMSFHWVPGQDMFSCVFHCIVHRDPPVEGRDMLYDDGARSGPDPLYRVPYWRAGTRYPPSPSLAGRDTLHAYMTVDVGIYDSIHRVPRSRAGTRYAYVIYSPSPLLEGRDTLFVHVMYSWIGLHVPQQYTVWCSTSMHAWVCYTHMWYMILAYAMILSTASLTKGPGSVMCICIWWRMMLARTVCMLESKYSGTLDDLSIFCTFPVLWHRYTYIWSVSDK